MNENKKKVIIIGVLIVIIIILIAVILLTINVKSFNLKQKDANQEENKEVVKEETLSIQNQLVRQLYSYINDKTKGYLYSIGGFTNEIPNDVKLMLGLYHLLDSEEIIEDENTGIISLKKADLTNSIKTIFGTDKYTDGTVVKEIMNGYPWIWKTKYNSTEKTYDVRGFAGGGGPTHYMDEYLKDAKMIGDNKIEIYVQPYYMQAIYDNSEFTGYKVFKNFDFGLLKNNTVEEIEKLHRNEMKFYSDAELVYDSKEGYDPIIKKDLEDKLDIYVYTFLKNNDGTGNYYLNSFKKL
ncbi:MAG: hypothetical protein RSB67_02520 [Clostridia bacterium]